MKLLKFMALPSFLGYSVLANLNYTFSSELVLKLLDMYYTKGVVYDPFMGTGSTGVACEMLGIKWLGSEISTAQCEYARKRLEEI